MVSNDAIIAIAFGLVSTIIALITVYIMWKDRSSRTSESRSGDIELGEQHRPVQRSSQDAAAPLIPLDDPQVARLPRADPHELHQAVGDFFHAMARMLNPPTT
ncbi:hypothetical protein V8E51_016296 [Hyaloscypha variabilis]